MATWTIKFFPYNILESGTLVVTGDADFGFPESRLYDRAISLFWKDTATEAKDFTIDQGATGNLDVDFLAISKHNFDGKDMQWQWSTDNFSGSINDAVTDWNQSGNGQIIYNLDPAITARYWRNTLASITNPQCDEIFMGLGYSFNALREQNPNGRDIDNVQWNKTVGGNERSTKFGEDRESRTYTMWMNAAEYADFLTVKSYLDGYSKSFYFKDHEDNYFMARFDGTPDEDFNHNINTLVTVRILEQL